MFFLSLFQIPVLDLTSPTYSLKKPLGETGIVNIFNPNFASLGGISPNRNVHVTDVLHKVRISIGIAESMTNQTRTSRSRQFGNTLFENNPAFFDLQDDNYSSTKIQLGKSFFFFIIDSRTEMILFAGKRTDNETEPIELNTISVVGQGTSLDNKLLTSALTEKTTEYLLPTNAYQIVETEYNQTMMETANETLTSAEAPTTDTMEPTASSDMSTPVAIAPPATTEEFTSAPVTETTVTKLPQLDGVKLNDIYKQASIYIQGNKEKEISTVKNRHPTTSKRNLNKVKAVGSVKLYKL